MSRTIEELGADPALGGARVTGHKVVRDGCVGVEIGGDGEPRYGYLLSRGGYGFFVMNAEPAKWRASYLGGTIPPFVEEMRKRMTTRR